MSTSAGAGDPRLRVLNLWRAVDAEAGRERGVLRTQGEHTLGELDRWVVADAVSEEGEFAAVKEALARGEGEGEGGDEAHDRPHSRAIHGSLASMWSGSGFRPRRETE